MEPVKRTERLSAMALMLSEASNRSLSLQTFCDAFGAAKSTISEDLDILKDALNRFDLGEVSTMPGATGGVRYRPSCKDQKALDAVGVLATRLSEAGRLLPGGLLYLADVIADPAIIAPIGAVLATHFFDAEPDFVLTMETQGIPLAMMTARALSIPVLIARRQSKAYEGPAVHINYLVGTQFKTMSLSRRLIKPGARALIVDDVLRTGGTVRGMMDLLHEFEAVTAGIAVLSATTEAALEYPDVCPLTIFEKGTHDNQARVLPGKWLKEVPSQV